MNRQLIISNDELKAILKTNESDFLLGVHNQIATNNLCDILGVQDLGFHTVTKTPTFVWEGGKTLCFRDFPVDTATIILYDCFGNTIDMSGKTYRLNGFCDQIVHLEEAGKPYHLGYKDVVASYTAGYRTQSFLEIITNPTDGDILEFISVGTTTIYTFKDTPVTATDIQIGIDASATMVNLASKIGGTYDIADEVILPLGMEYSTGDVTVSVDDATVPDDLKYVVALLAGGSLMNIEKSGSVVQYKLGDKQVVFRSEGEMQSAMAIIDFYTAKYSKIYVA